jgi:ABC-type amino acid transport system permease subunit
VRPSLRCAAIAALLGTAAGLGVILWLLSVSPAARFVYLLFARATPVMVFITVVFGALFAFRPGLTERGVEKDKNRAGAALLANWVTGLALAILAPVLLGGPERAETDFGPGLLVVCFQFLIPTQVAKWSLGWLRRRV